MVDDRIVPCNLDAERSVLGAIILNDSVWPKAAALVSGHDFFRDAHRRIYEAMARLVATGSTPADFTLLNAELDRVGELGEVGGPAYVASLVDGLPHATNVEHYAAIVREKAVLRTLISQTTRLLTAAYTAEQESSTLIDEGVRDLLRLGDQRSAASMLAVDAVGRYITAFDEPDTSERLKTGYLDFDDLVGGVRVGELTIVAARPSVGKSSWALAAAQGVAKGQRTAAVFSLEMSIPALSARLIGWGARISPHRLESRQLIEPDYPKISAAWAALDGLPLVLEEVAPSLTQIAARCQVLQQQDRGLACIVVDYMQQMTPDARGRSREEEVSALSRGLKRLAKDRHLAVIAVSQLSRAPEGRADKRPHLSDLRESGALEQDADLVVLLYRQEMHSSKDEDKGTAEVIVAKNRNGPTGTVRMGWIEDFAQFVNLAPLTG